MTKPDDAIPVENLGRCVYHSCGGTLYRVNQPNVRWCDKCCGWIPWEGEFGIIKA